MQRRRRMVHERMRRLVPMLADSALGPLRRFMVARHVAHCPDCAADLETLQSMHTVIRAKLPLHRAPPGLAARIGAALPREGPPPAPARLGFRAPALAVGSGMAGALAGVALMLVVMSGRDANDAAIQAIIGGHIRSQVAEHLTDVTTSDQHTVKPFLSARLDVSPPVKELAGQGFPLIGGGGGYRGGGCPPSRGGRPRKAGLKPFPLGPPRAA